MFSGQYLKLLASLRYAINISASACYTRLSRGEQVKRHFFFLLHLFLSSFFLVIYQFIRSVVDAGTGKNWLSAQLCTDAVILLISETRLDLRSLDMSLCPPGIPNEKKQIWSFCSSTVKHEHFHTKQRTSYFIKMYFRIFHLDIQILSYIYKLLAEFLFKCLLTKPLQPSHVYALELCTSGVLVRTFEECEWNQHLTRPDVILPSASAVEIQLGTNEMKFAIFRGFLADNLDLQ